MQVRTLLKEQGACKESALGDNHHATTLLGSTVDDSLDGLGLHHGRIATHTKVGNHILLTQLSHINFSSILKPRVHHGLVGPNLNGGFLFGFCNSRSNQRHGKQQEHYSSHFSVICFNRLQNYGLFPN